MKRVQTEMTHTPEPGDLARDSGVVGQAAGGVPSVSTCCSGAGGATGALRRTRRGRGAAGAGTGAGALSVAAVSISCNPAALTTSSRLADAA